MKKFFPSYKLGAYIDCYCIIKDAKTFFKDEENVVAYPGVTPELMIVLDGFFSFQYEGKKTVTSKATLFSFIDEKLIFDHSSLKSFIIVQFKPLALFSLRQFIPISSKELMAKPIRSADEFFNNEIDNIASLATNLSFENVVAMLNSFFLRRLKSDSNTYVISLLECIKKGTRLKDMEVSYATLERHFKIQTGLTPKKFQSLHRYKLAVQEIYETKNSDWIHYVEKYNYFDQSHFIKEIKRYTSFTPAQLFLNPALLNYRKIAM